MAEYIMKYLAGQAGLSDRFEIDSAAVSAEETGNPVYPPARRILHAHGIPCGNHRARQMTRADYDCHDLLIGMDTVNIAWMKRICGGDPEHKIRQMMDYTDRPGDVSDPWYTGDFETAYRDILAGCTGLIAQTEQEK
ncbi:MAG: low molecular weight phosphotyrosine protein phosphatase [Solobacterium sp.]|nr:low molecular weight phosphotyrosine protein phosphatase [Solobacterium sp.]MBR0214096.1 low molecular weight phosphotyrosine protein phosphatase [Solobacterium sp.]